MRSPLLAPPPRPQLTLVAAGGQAFGVGPQLSRERAVGSSGHRAVTRIGLDLGEWALALLPPGTQRREARPLVRSLVAGWRPSGGSRCTVVRVPAGTLASQLGPAVFHCTRDQVTVYCRDDELREEAALALADIASRAVGIFGPSEAGYEISLVRVADHELPDARWPAQVETDGPAVTAYVVEDTVGADLADALGLLATACASYFAQAASGGDDWDSRPPLH